jgi:FkbM family methyltransferase
MENRTITYSQNREDLIIRNFFKDIKDGFYVDIGASHPVIDSVTKLFYEMGWHGINVEPNQNQYRLLLEDRPRDININVGIADKAGKLRLREYEGYGLSTFSNEMKKGYEADSANKLTNKYTDRTVDVITLKQLFETYKVKEIQFMKVDVEGFEYEALKGNDWVRYRPQLICIESNHMIKNWKKFLLGKGYIKCFNDGLNDYFVAEECKNLADGFSYPNAVLLSGPIIPLRWHQEIGSINRKHELEVRTEQLRQSEVKRELEIIQHKLNETQRIRKQAINLYRSLDDVVLLFIGKLYKDKKRKETVVETLELSKDNDLKTNLLAIKSNDFENFYQKKGVYKKYKNIRYYVIKNSYIGIRDLSKKITKIAYRSIKALKRSF